MNFFDSRISNPALSPVLRWAWMSYMFLLGLLPVSAQTFPAGFSQVPVARGISSPTVMAFAPDGRIFVAQQNGQLRVIKNGQLLAAPFVQLNVNASGERGLIGIALAPDFATSGFVYLYYTLSNGSRNRISRFTANGDVARAGSETVVLDLDPLSSATNHNGGAMHFGRDGKLYVAVGENATPRHAQNLDTYHGKILRINPDGSVPAGNPYTSGSAQKRRVWAYGLRNPYTIDIRPGTGRFFVNDVGQSAWEEINDATPGGRNFGWPGAEGKSAHSAYANPVYAYQHGSGDGKGCALTGGVFFSPASTNYPTQYRGRYFYQDYCNNWINMLDLSVTPAARRPFATNLPGRSLAIDVGRDGNLYYLSRSAGALYKIIYNAPGTAPAITSQPANATVARGRTAGFSVTATGTPPLSYQWQKNNVNIAGATAATYTIASATSASAGQYRVIVSNGTGRVTSNAATLTVTAPNAAPTARILAPSSGTLYSGGATISFSGSATDPEDGTLPARAYKWSVVFHHDTHTHDGPPVATGASSGRFMIPNSGETSARVWYRLYLTVTDSKGLTSTVYRDLHPRTSKLTFATNPAGLRVTLDGQSLSTPAAITGVEGMVREIGVPASQTVGGVTYQFDRWSQGGSATQTITTPLNDVTYTANFKATALRNPENPANAVAGLNYTYYEGNWNALPDFAALTPVKTGQLTNFDLTPRNRNDYFAFRYTGYVQIPADGTYTFYTSSDDGSQLSVGNTRVVNNDGQHGVQERSGTIGLKAGKHALTVTVFEKTGSQSLAVSYAGPGIAKRVVPASALFRAGTGPLAVKINFQPASSPVPAGYLADAGAAYGNRGNGYSYGWNATTSETRDRANPSAPDQRYNTLIHLQKPSNPNAAWEIGLPNGTYRVDLVAGDPSHTDQVNTLNVEGNILGDSDGQDNFDAYSTTVTVSDGRLTIRPASGSRNAKLNFADIKQISAAPARVASVQEDDSPLPQLQQSLKAYPNPASRVLTVSYESLQAGPAQISVTDVNARTHMTATHFSSPGTNTTQLNVSPLRSGTYLLTVRIGKQTAVQQFIVQQK